MTIGGDHGSGVFRSHTYAAKRDDAYPGAPHTSDAERLVVAVETDKLRGD
jgi:hypothetical protein